jgi:4'-phosphopantetheinyl transferase
MPLFHTEHLSPDCWWGLWHIAETEAELLPLVAGRVELGELATISHPTKRIEWLAVRALCCQLLPSPPTFGHIAKDTFGRPYLTNSSSSIQVSFSHTGPWAVVALHRTAPLGIDIEREGPALARVAPRLFSPGELVEAETLAQKTIFWCAKEAIYKLHGQRGLDFREHIAVHWQAGELHGWVLAQPPSQVACTVRRWRDCWVVVAF